ncbi:putative uncharacterized protein DDB_G0282133 [Lucilia sericata]|uniref:putative uncharacterized protein DDB_G0282133 n=1 Tax=Lucilia sericata TaxID=13632 RepID=UPI0018A82C6D|nr:putative uncharacterized protein DDB_G0282133 [Lucilia sericata]
MLITRKFLYLSLTILLIESLTICAHAKSLPNNIGRNGRRKNIKSRSHRSKGNIIHNEPILYTLPKPIKQIQISSKSQDNFSKPYMNDVEYDLRLRQLMEELVLRSHAEKPHDISTEHYLEKTPNNDPQNLFSHNPSNSIDNNNIVLEPQQISVIKDLPIDYDAPLNDMTKTKNLTNIANGITTSPTSAQKIRQQLEFLQKNAEKFKQFQQVQERTKNVSSQTPLNNMTEMENHLSHYIVENLAENNVKTTNSTPNTIKSISEATENSMTSFKGNKDEYLNIDVAHTNTAMDKYKLTHSANGLEKETNIAKQNNVTNNIYLIKPMTKENKDLPNEIDLPIPLIDEIADLTTEMPYSDTTLIFQQSEHLELTTPKGTSKKYENYFTTESPEDIKSYESEIDDFEILKEILNSSNKINREENHKNELVTKYLLATESLHFMNTTEQPTTSNFDGVIYQGVNDTKLPNSKIFSHSKNTTDNQKEHMNDEINNTNAIEKNINHTSSHTDFHIIDEDFVNHGILNHKTQGFSENKYKEFLIDQTTELPDYDQLLSNETEYTFNDSSELQDQTSQLHIAIDISNPVSDEDFSNESTENYESTEVLSTTNIPEVQKESENISVETTASNILEVLNNINKSDYMNSAINTEILKSKILSSASFKINQTTQLKNYISPNDNVDYSNEIDYFEHLSNLTEMDIEQSTQSSVETSQQILPLSSMSITTDWEDYDESPTTEAPQETTEIPTNDLPVTTEKIKLTTEISNNSSTNFSIHRDSILVVPHSDTDIIKSSETITQKNNSIIININDADNSLIIDTVKNRNSDIQFLRNQSELLTTEMYQSDISPTKNITTSLKEEIEAKGLAMQTTNNPLMETTTIPEDNNNYEEYLSFTTTTPAVRNNYGNNIEEFNVQNTLLPDKATDVYLKNIVQKNETNSEVLVQSERNSLKSQFGNGPKDSGNSTISFLLQNKQQTKDETKQILPSEPVSDGTLAFEEDQNNSYTLESLDDYNNRKLLGVSSQQLKKDFSNDTNDPNIIQHKILSTYLIESIRNNLPKTPNITIDGSTVNSLPNNISYEHKNNMALAEVETSQTTFSLQDFMEDNDEDEFIETSTSILDINTDSNNNTNKQSILTLKFPDISNRSNFEASNITKINLVDLIKDTNFEMEDADNPDALGSHNENLMSSENIDRNGEADETSSTAASFKNYMLDNLNNNDFESEYIVNSITDVSPINNVPIDVNSISGKNSFHNTFADSYEEDNLDTSYTKIPSERKVDEDYDSSEDATSETSNILVTADLANSSSYTTQSFNNDIIPQSNSSEIFYNNGTSNFVQDVTTHEEFTTETNELSDSQYFIGDSTALTDDFNESDVDLPSTTTVDNSWGLKDNITNDFTPPNENTETVTEVVWLTQSSSYEKPSIIIENIPYETSISGPLYTVSNDLANTAKVTILKPEEKSDHLSELIALIGNSLQDSTQTSELQQQTEDENKNINDNKNVKESRLQKIQEDITSTVNCHTGTMSFSIPSSPSPPSVEFESEEVGETKLNNSSAVIEKIIGNDKQNKWSTFKNNQLNNDSLSKSGNLPMKKNANADDGNAVADIDDDIDVYVNAADDIDVANDEGTTTYSNEKNMKLEMKVENKGSINEKTDKNSDNDRVVENGNNDNGSTVQHSTNNEVETSQYEGGINEMSTIENKLHDISKSESNVMTRTATSSHDKHEMADNKYNKKDYLNKGNGMIIKNDINPNSMSGIKTPNKDDEIDDAGGRPNDKTENIFNNLLKTQSFPATTPYNTNSDKNILASAQTKEEITTTNWWHSLPYAEIRKFLNSIFDSVTSTDNISLNESVDSTVASATVPKTSSQTNASKLKTIKGRKSKKEQWPIWVLNNIWSSLL